MTSAEIRESFLQFFRERGHAIVPSSPVVPYDDPTLLFTNAGMNQFKDVFLGQGKRSYTRAADTQKCIRVSGKHNDLEEVGRDTYHHTFFEMLGNWSFGDYYKKEAIEWAWDLLTRVWGLPKDRLWATVYKDDGEAEDLWKKATDIDHAHVLRFGEKDNFWEMGETGPCGPCSEIHIDRTPGGTATAAMVNAGVAEVMEIWNLVFIQYNRDASGTLTPLPAKHVDTGMGFERMCAVLQNKHSNYDTDVFMPVIHRIAGLAGTTYDGRLHDVTPQQFERDTAMRVLADHVRALTFAISDGATPSNEGRGYVLRRLLRRAARFGRNLGMKQPFIFQLVPTLVETMGGVFPELRSKQEHVQKIIRAEEEGFNSTLDRGLEIFEGVVKQLGSSKTFPGADAFKLYDTYGFPLDLTELLVNERGLHVDVTGFNERMDEQRKRSRAVEMPGQPGAGESEIERTSLSDAALAKDKSLAKAAETEEYESRFRFLGYDSLQSPASVLSSRDNLLILDATPFYGEAGGQVGDTGIIDAGGTQVLVLDTQKSGHVNIHILAGPLSLGAGSEVRALVDADRRRAIMRNHSATHLAHAALRRILGTHVHQAGSLVAPGYLRFDFAHFSKVSEEELAAIESLVNEKIREHITLNHHRDIPFEEAKKMGALMFFGDKYGDRVNVVEFGDFSREFCGGTHVHNTADIGYFKFRSEGSVASGVRRIEAVTGEHAFELLAAQDKDTFERLEYSERQYQELTAALSQLRSLSPETASKSDTIEREIEPELARLRAEMHRGRGPQMSLQTAFAEQARRHATVETLLLSIADKLKAVERELSRIRLQSQTGQLDQLVASARTLDGIRIVSSQVESGSLEELKSIGDALRSKLMSGVGLLAAIIDAKVSLVCVVTDDLAGAKKLEAGKIVGAVAKLVGGGGGGKAHLATAGGRDPGKLPEALEAVHTIVQASLAREQAGR